MVIITIIYVIYKSQVLGIFNNYTSRVQDQRKLATYKPERVRD